MVLIGLNQHYNAHPIGKKTDSNPLAKYCVREFDAEVVILHHATTI